MVIATKQPDIRSLVPSNPNPPPAPPRPGLLMEYFVLKPKGKGPHAKAARDAMRAYAKSIESVNPVLAEELHKWAQREMLASIDIDVEKC